MKINTLPQPGNSVLRFSRRFIVASLAFGLCLNLAPAQSLQWDANGTSGGVTDGGGTWNLTNQNWSNGTTTDVWNNNGSTIAVFGNGGVVGTSAGAATVTVSGSVNAGGLQFNAIDLTSNTSNRSYILSGGTINLATGALIQINDLTSNTGSGRITLSSSLAGSNITFQKNGTVDSAFVSINGNNSWTGTLTLATGGGGLFIRPESQAAISTLSSIDVQSGNSLVLAYSSATPTSVPIQINGTGLGSRGAIRFDVNHTLSGAVTLAGNAGISVNTGNANLVGTVAGNIGETGGSRSLTLNASSTAIGTIVLGGNNTFTGGVILNAGSLRLGSANALNASGVNSLTFAANTVAKTFTLNGFSTTVAGLIQQGTTDAVTVENASASAATLTIANATSATFRGTIADGTSSAALTLAKSGTGTQTLTGTANTYTGGTVLNGGILNIAADGSLGAVPASVDPDNITFNGGTLQFAYAGSQATPSLNANRGITLLAGGGTLDTLANSTYYAGAITGAGSLAKSGTASLILAGASDFTGEMVVNAGTLQIQNALALGSTAGRTRLASGTRLELSGGITVTGEAVLTPLLASVAGNNTWAGTVQGVVGSTLTFETATGTQLNVTGNVNAADIEGGAHSFNLIGSGTGVISGSISNTLTITKSGTGTWTLSGNNIFTNGVALSQGELILGSYGALNSSAPNAVTFGANANTKTLSLQGTSSIVGGLISTSATGVTTQNGGATDATLTIQNSATRTYLGALADGSGGGKLSILKTGTGTQVLGSASTYTGTTTVAAGTLQLDFNQTGAPTTQILSSSTGLVMSGGTFSVTGSATAAASQTVQSLTVAGGSSTISVARNATTPQDVVLNLGNITPQNGGRVNFILPSGTQSATNGIRTSSSNDASGILGGWATVGGTNWATVSSGNIVAYTAYTDITNFSTGGTPLGPLPNNANANVRIITGGTSGNIALANTTTTINTLLQTATGEAIIDVPSGSTLRLGTSGGIMLGTGAGNLTIGTTANSGVLTAGGSTSGTPGQLIFIDQSSGQTTTVNNAIRDNGTNGTVSLVKNGPGLLVLAATGNSTFTGSTSIYGGTVRISADSSLGTAPTSAVSNHLVLNGGTLQMAASFTLNANRGMLLGENGGTLDLQTFSTTYNGIISGTGGLTKNGNGTLTLGGASTYDGVTTVNFGTLQVNHNNALGSTAGGTVVLAGTVLRLNAGVTVTGETLFITGNNSGNGNLQVQTGTATWAGDIVINGTNIARIGTNTSAGILIIDGVIRNGTGSNIAYVANGGGLVVLNKNNTYTGGSDIVRGTIQLGTDNALPTTTILNILTNASAVPETVSLDLNGNDQTLAGLKSGVVSNYDNSFVTNSKSGDSNLSVLTLNLTTGASYSGRIEGNLALVKDGSATFTLTNTYNAAGTTPTATQSTYTGKTTIRAGTLALSGTGNISGTPWIQVDQGATFSISGRTSGNYTLNGQVLSGRGSVDGSLIVSGSSGYVSAGDSTGTLLSNAGNGLGELTFNNLTLAGGTPTLRALFQLGDTNSTLADLLSGGDPTYFANADSGGLYDSIQVNGTLGLNAGSTLRVELLGSYVPTVGDVFNLLDWVNPLNTDADGVGGAGAFTLADLDLTSANAILAGSGMVFNTDQFLQHGLIYVVVVPEPSRALFLTLGLLTLLATRRRRASL